MQLGKNTFDLIISDIEMPNFDGFQLLQMMNEKNIQIPVVFITSHIEPEFKQKSSDLGAVHFIEKPIKNKVLLEAINDLL